MKLRDMNEQGEYISKHDEDAPEMDTLEDRLNRAVFRFKGLLGDDGEIWVDVDEQRGEIEVFFHSYDMVRLDIVNSVARLIRDTAMAELVGITGGARASSFYLNFKR